MMYFLNKKLDGSYDLIVLKPQEKQNVIINKEKFIIRTYYSFFH